MNTFTIQKPFSPSRRSAAVRLLIMDEDPGFLRVLEPRFERDGIERRVVAGPVPIDELIAQRLSAVVIDIRVLGNATWQYLEDLCLAVPDLAVVVCTTHSTVAQRVRGLQLGLDDWISKPCHPEEFVARLAAVMRRRDRAYQTVEREEALVAGDLKIRPKQFEVAVAGQIVDLTRREFELLLLLARNEGIVLEREEIYQRVWGYTMARGDRSVDVFVRKLRHKLERRSQGWQFIHTQFGIGYRFSAQPKASV